jgi:guanylate kinase
MATTGTVFILSAPSGGGKSTILKRVMAAVPGLVFSVSHTTRQSRPNEQNGRDYHFVERREFLEIRDQDPSGFLEWAEVHGNMYGTSRHSVQQQLFDGLDVVLDIDVQGARQLRNELDSVSVFIAPPSLGELEKRLRRRGTEEEHILQLRLQNAKKELKATVEYDYLIINDSLDDAVKSFTSIIIAERCRHRRTPDGAFIQVGIFDTSELFHK